MNKYPRGKLNETDEGALNIRLTNKNDTVIIDFGKNVSWIGLDKQTAIDFASMILKHADSINYEKDII